MSRRQLNCTSGLTVTLPAIPFGRVCVCVGGDCTSRTQGANVYRSVDGMGMLNLLLVFRYMRAVYWLLPWYMQIGGVGNAFTPKFWSVSRCGTEQYRLWKPVLTALLCVRDANSCVNCCAVSVGSR